MVKNQLGHVLTAGPFRINACLIISNFLVLQNNVLATEVEDEMALLLVEWEQCEVHWTTETGNVAFVPSYSPVRVDKATLISTMYSNCNTYFKKERKLKREKNCG